jgi:hypothetical protein
MSRHDSGDRRASDASVLGMSMEARMARIESMMESLVQERALTVTPGGSMERDDIISDELFTSHFSHGRRASSKLECPEWTRPSTSAPSLSNRADSPATVRLGSTNLLFPRPFDYQKYIDFLFHDLSPYYPCINEADFRMRSEQMLAAPVIHNSDTCFLALHYMIFACSDIAVDSFPVGVNPKPPGWQWFNAADDLVRQRELSGRADMSLIQYLVLKVSHCVYLCLQV